jgi:transposase
MSEESTQVTPQIMSEWQLTKSVPSSDGSKLTPAVVATVLGNLAAGCYVETACAAAGIGKSTYYSWLERAEEDPDSAYAEFAALVEKARAQAEAANLRIIRKAANDSWQAAAWLLERVYPEKYGMRNRTTVDGGMLIAPTSAAGLIAAMREAANGETQP